PADFIRAQLKGIVGFELPIVRLEGKWKMSQNRPAEDRAGVIEGLRREGGPAEATVADLVTAANEKGRGSTRRPVSDDLWTRFRGAFNKGVPSAVVGRRQAASSASSGFQRGDHLLQVPTDRKHGNAGAFRLG